MKKLKPKQVGMTPTNREQEKDGGSVKRELSKPEELFQKVQTAQGFFHVADDEGGGMTEEQFFERVRGRLAWGRKAVKIMDAFLRKYGETDAMLSARRPR